MDTRGISSQWEEGFWGRTAHSVGGPGDTTWPLPQYSLPWRPSPPPQKRGQPLSKSREGNESGSTACDERGPWVWLLWQPHNVKALAENELEKSWWTYVWNAKGRVPWFMAHQLDSTGWHRRPLKLPQVARKKHSKIPYTWYLILFCSALHMLRTIAWYPGGAQ